MKLTATQQLILIALMTNADWSEDIAWVTKGRLSDHLGLHPEVIHRNVRALRKLGLVGDPVRRVRPGGQGEYHYGFELRVRDADLPRVVARMVSGQDDIIPATPSSGEIE